jgi:hypothetical protein
MVKSIPLLWLNRSVDWFCSSLHLGRLRRGLAFQPKKETRAKSFCELTACQKTMLSRNGVKKVSAVLSKSKHTASHVQESVCDRFVNWFILICKGLKAKLEVKIPELQDQWKQAKVLSDKVIHKVTVDQVCSLFSSLLLLLNC